MTSDPTGTAPEFNASIRSALVNQLLAGPTYPANFLIEGRFKSITLASGSVIAYNAHN